jgi:hypothetical protein
LVTTHHSVTRKNGKKFERRNGKLILLKNRKQIMTLSAEFSAGGTLLTHSLTHYYTHKKKNTYYDV